MEGPAINFFTSIEVMLCPKVAMRSPRSKPSSRLVSFGCLQKWDITSTRLRKYGGGGELIIYGKEETSGK